MARLTPPAGSVLCTVTCDKNLEARSGGFSGTVIAATKAPRRNTYVGSYSSDAAMEKARAESQKSRKLTAAFFDEVERRVDVHGAVGWALVGNHWELITAAHPHAKKAVPLGNHPGLCCRMMTSEGGWAFPTCARAAAGDPVMPGDCKMHLSHVRRALTERDNRRAEGEQRHAEQQRVDRLAVDLRGAWETACDRLGIEPERRGRATVTAHSAVVDREALLVILRFIDMNVEGP